MRSWSSSRRWSAAPSQSPCPRGTGSPSHVRWVTWPQLETIYSGSPGKDQGVECHHYQARDADQFVRVWMRGHTMLYTGTIRHEEDPRLELAGEDGSSLVITDLTEEDSGQYECRIMVEKPVVVTHSLTVANIFAIHTEPAEAVVSVPLRGHTRLGCSTTGGQADIEWTRDGGKFSNNDSYNYQGDFLELADVTTQVQMQFAIQTIPEYEY